jgi:hypothetical protein
MSITVSIADDLAQDLKPYEAQFSEIIALGIRELRARQEPGFNGINSVFEKLAALPAPEEVMALRPSPVLQERLDALLEKNRGIGLSSAEEREWDQYQYLEHLVRLAKASAARRIKDAKGP